MLCYRVGQKWNPLGTVERPVQGVIMSLLAHHVTGTTIPEQNNGVGVMDQHNQQDATAKKFRSGFRNVCGGTLGRTAEGS